MQPHNRRDLLSELDSQSAPFPPAWKPKEGESLVGVILRYSKGPTPYGECRTALIECDDGQRWSLWLSSTVLLDLFKREKPKAGERIGVRYLGKHPEKGYNRFALVVDREEEELTFEPLGGEAVVPASADDDPGDPFEDPGLPEWALGRKTGRG